MSTVTVSPKFQVVIPKEIREQLALEPQGRYADQEEAYLSPRSRREFVQILGNQLTALQSGEWGQDASADTLVAELQAEIAALEHSVDLTVDATGVPAVAATLPIYTANGGKVLYFGVCPPDARIEISPFEVFRRQLTIAGAHSLNHNIADAVAALNAIGPGVTRLVSHELPLEEIPKVLLKQGPEGTLKVQAG